MDPEIRIAGLPVSLKIDGYGYYVQAVFTTVYIRDQPLDVFLQPPVATIDEVPVATLLLALLGALASGAIIRP